MPSTFKFLFLKSIQANKTCETRISELQKEINSAEQKATSEEAKHREVSQRTLELQVKNPFPI